MSPEPLKTSTPKSRHREFFEKLYGSLETSGKSSAKLGKIVTWILISTIERKACRSSLTMWKFQDFSGIQILHEINFRESISSKTAIFAILGPSQIVKMHENKTQILWIC